jgi:hypothetical protein
MMERVMNLREIAALMRRHLLAVTLVLTIAAGAGYDIRSTPPVYSQSATVVFTATDSPADSNLKTQFINPLIATEVMMTQIMTGSEAQSQVRAAGGTAQFGIVPENLYSLQYPNYSEPSATLTTTSPNTADVQRTFTVVLRILGQRLAAIQAQAGAPPSRRIRTFVLAQTRPVAQPGSPMRAFAGLAVLTLVALVMVPTFLDRRRSPVRRTARAGSRRRSAAVSARSDP